MGLRDRLNRATARVVADPVAQALHEAAREAMAASSGTSFSPYSQDFAKTEAAAALMGRSPAELPAVALACLKTSAAVHHLDRDEAETSVRFAGWQVAGRLLRRKLEWSDEGLAEVLDVMVRGSRGALYVGWTPIVPAVGAAERHLGGAAATGELARALRGVRDKLPDDADGKRLGGRVDVVLGVAAPPDQLGDEDPWRAVLLRAVSEMAGAQSETARAVVTVASTAGAGAKPTKAFLAGRDALVAERGAERTGTVIAVLLRALASVPAKAEHGQVPPDTGDLMRGLAWVAGATQGAPAASGLAALAVAGWRKVPGFGPQCRKAASAAVSALGEHPDGAGQFGAVKARLKQPGARAEVDAAIDRAAAALGISREDFEERLVPDFELRDGTHAEQLGAHAAELAVNDRLAFQLSFTTATGRRLKSVPAEVKNGHADRLVELKALRKDAQQMLDAQRLRLERLLLHDPRWSTADWIERYAAHGLLAPLTRRLIWCLDDDVSVTFHDGVWRQADGAEADLTSHTAVRLWHPALASGSEVLAWRTALEQWGLQQPFKQAHREVYLLTDAERTTDVYSNRFAGHIIRQHQFAALARARGWSYALQGAWDSPEEQARLPLESHNLEASFWVDRPWDAEEDWNDSGVFNHVLTDQVRFVTSHGDEIHLADVPVLVLSEILRDVDLFVGVASIGNDPSWADSGGARRDTWGGYWTDYSFGELGAAAEIRRDLLARLVPKLAIADVATLDERFLRVRGTRRTYKIHLGSGNILMEPNDQYLCIVPGRGDTDAHGVRLPFEGDNLLSIILSKAMLLASDDKITDKTITSQITQQ